MSAGKQDNRYPCDRVVSIEEEPRHHLVIKNEYVRVFAVEIAPHDRTLCHHHPHDYLVYVVDIADVVSAARNEEPKTLLYKNGECEMARAGMVHVVENLRDTPFRNIVIEFLPRFAELRRGPDLRREFMADGAVESLASALPGITRDALSVIRTHFDGERVRVFQFQMTANVEVGVSGPSVIASPEGGARWTEPGKDQVILNSFRQLVWVPEGRDGILRGQQAGVVVFQLGESG